MTSAAFDPVAPADNSFESWARALCQFVIRAAILPVSILFIKPSAFLRSTETGEYRPLPSPFLLALITGIVISGVTSNLSKFNLEPREGAAAGTLGANTDFFTSVVDFYMSLNGVNTILYAIPYVFGLWLAAGLTSLFMFRGIRTAEALMTAIAFGLAALVEVTILMVGFSLVFDVERESVVLWIALGFLIYTLVVLSKLVRLLFVIRKQRGAPLIGAILGSVPLVLIFLLAGLVGSALAVGVHNQRGYIAEMAQLEAERRASEARALAGAFFARRDYAAAVTAYDEAIANNPTAENYNSRCWARAVWGEDLVLAALDCDTSLSLDPANRYAMDSRGLVLLKSGDYEAAIVDYTSAIAQDPAYAHALYGRGIAHLRLGHAEEGRADIQAALALDPQLQATYAEYGVEQDAATSTLRGRPLQDAGDPRMILAPVSPELAAPSAGP